MRRVTWLPFSAVWVAWGIIAPMSIRPWPDPLQPVQPDQVAGLLAAFWETLAELPDSAPRATNICSPPKRPLRYALLVLRMMLALNGIERPPATHHLNTYLGASQRAAIEKTLLAPAVAGESWIGQAVALVVIYRWYAPQLVEKHSLAYPQAAEDAALTRRPSPARLAAGHHYGLTARHDRANPARLFCGPLRAAPENHHLGAHAAASQATRRARLGGRHRHPAVGFAAGQRTALGRAGRGVDERGSGRRHRCGTAPDDGRDRPHPAGHRPRGEAARSRRAGAMVALAAQKVGFGASGPPFSTPTTGSRRGRRSTAMRRCWRAFWPGRRSGASATPTASPRPAAGWSIACRRPHRTSRGSICPTA